MAQRASARPGARPTLVAASLNLSRVTNTDVVLSFIGAPAGEETVAVAVGTSLGTSLGGAGEQLIKIFRAQVQDVSVLGICGFYLLRLTLIHFILLIIAFVIIIGLKIYSESDAYNLKCIISDVDGKRYCVRERLKMELAANLLASVTQKLKDLVIYCAKKFPDNENVQRMVQKFNPTKISETLPTSEYTAYSENKGEKLAFCLNKEKNGSKYVRSIM
jgi:hypothetical protein